MSVRRLLRLICHGCTTNTYLLGTGHADTDRHGAALYLGRRSRLASPAQRTALAGRCFPGCDAPPAWCEAHHVIAWAAGGPTNIDNLCLLCPHHHRAFEQAGWHLTMTNGLPWWTPPGWLDPHQQPRRNHAHHPPDIATWLTRKQARKIGPPQRDDIPPIRPDPVSTG